MITSWGISEFECFKNQDGFNNVIKTITWNYFAIDGEYSTELNGVTELDPPTENFIEYGDLTKDIVISMIQTKLDINEMNTKMQDIINTKKNDKIIVIKPEW